MDAKKIGSLIASQRKGLGLTQAELAGKLHVTDKAVSRWECGQGFPDLHMIEPLADALELSIAEVMRGEKNTSGLSDEAASSAAKSVIHLVEMKREEHQMIVVMLVAVALLLSGILLMDVIGLMGLIGVALPCFGLTAGMVLAGAAVMRKRRRLPIKAMMVWAAILMAVPVIMAVLFFIVGILGIGPVPN